jgi:hypothetical protein
MPTNLTQLQRHFSTRAIPTVLIGSLGCGVWQFRHGDWLSGVGAALFAFALLQFLSEITYQLLVVADVQHSE